jgi:hypothetical protein
VKHSFIVGSTPLVRTRKEHIMSISFGSKIVKDKDGNEHLVATIRVGSGGYIVPASIKVEQKEEGKDTK